MWSLGQGWQHPYSGDCYDVDSLASRQTSEWSQSLCSVRVPKRFLGSKRNTSLEELENQVPGVNCRAFFLDGKRDAEKGVLAPVLP